MAYQKGLAVLLKVDTATTGGPTYTTLAGIQANSIRIGADAVDVTNADSTARFRELLEGAGVKRLTLSGSGVFSDAAVDAKLTEYVMDGSIKLWQAIVPDFGTFAGSFQITQLDFNGPHDKEVQFSITIESAGEITFTAA